MLVTFKKHTFNINKHIFIVIIHFQGSGLLHTCCLIQRQAPTDPSQGTPAGRAGVKTVQLADLSQDQLQRMANNLDHRQDISLSQEAQVGSTNTNSCHKSLRQKKTDCCTATCYILCLVI